MELIDFTILILGLVAGIGGLSLLLHGALAPEFEPHWDAGYDASDRYRGDGR